MPQDVLDEARATSATRQRKILYVVNPGDSDSESDHDFTSPHSYSQVPTTQYSPHYPPSHPISVNTQYQSSKPSSPPYAPTLLTTNLPTEHSHHYQISNPTLSSPSSASSPAVESTPPSSTPGFSSPPVQIASEQAHRSDQICASYGSERSDSLGSRAMSMPEKQTSYTLPVLAHQPKQGSVSQRTSVSTCALDPRPFLIFRNQSPTASTPETYTPNSDITVRMDKMTLMVTSDAERYTTVDITGARDAAYIKERMFTKVRSRAESRELLS